MENSNLIKISEKEFNKNLKNLSSKEFAHKIFHTQEDEKSIYINYLKSKSEEFRGEVQYYLKKPINFLYL